MEDILLFGTGGHAHSVADSIEKAGKYRIIGFLDTEEMQGRHYREYAVLGTDSAMEKYYVNGVRNAFITIGYIGNGGVRDRLYCRLKEIGYQLPNIIDCTAVVADSAFLMDGIYIGKNAVVNADARIGEMCIINTGAVVEHDCRVGAYSHVAVNSVLCGGASVGSHTMIGANASVIQEIRVGDHVIIGAGTVVVKNVEDRVIRYGTVTKQRSPEGLE